MNPVTRNTALFTLLCGIAFPGFAAPDEETGLGNFRDQVQATNSLLVLDEVLSNRIAEIANRVVTASGQSGRKYTFRLLNDPKINAYATSGGFIYLNTGLLDVLESPDELAAVVAHEIVHIDKSHLVENIRDAQVKRVAIPVLVALGAAILSTGIANSMPQPAPYTPSISPSSVVEMGVQTGYAAGVSWAESSIKGYKKEQELEADLLAVDYLIGAGYDPYALVRFLKRLKGIRDRLIGDVESYASALINKSPGLEERLAQVEAALRARQHAPITKLKGTNQ